ncbi:MAG: flagellar motor stator protein MotA [Microvirga sp.]|uniref:Flagellar motor stator protein MotA n=1 Tax=Microvirga brassicacearum TaxID=2580413 RepID=A0A5N3P3M3_9HYPH|nr:flagellar motor stator protein MotA [Microvirga brassicacearum]KAB0264323.1 flagellar motor stator protein MotA [Microvirga brassicacearum]MDF2810269.1 flagellar motor stator protein MotA [Microvirga sp.]
MGALIGLVIAIGSLLGGFMAMGGKLGVIWQPWEYVIILGIAVGTFIIANPMVLVKDAGKACMEAIGGKVPKRADYLSILGLLYALLRELRSKPRNEVERHIDLPQESEIFTAFPSVLKDKELCLFICDYVRLIIIGNARPHEIESLMEHEIITHKKDSLKPYYAINTVAEALPALGIVAAVLGIVKAMGAIDQSPEILGGLIGAALVGTFAGIFISYALLSPLALKIKATRDSQTRVYVIVKQALIAYMNGALPQIAVEHGRKGISNEYRPSIDEVEAATTSGSRVEDVKEAA